MQAKELKNLITPHHRREVLVMHDGDHWAFLDECEIYIATPLTHPEHCENFPEDFECHSVVNAAEYLNKGEKK